MTPAKIFNCGEFNIALHEQQGICCISYSGNIPKKVMEGMSEITNAVPRPSFSMTEYCIRGILKQNNIEIKE